MGLLPLLVVPYMLAMPLCDSRGVWDVPECMPQFGGRQVSSCSTRGG